MKKIVVLALAIALMTVPAYAATVTYDFNVTSTIGPTTVDGTFSFDSGFVVTGGVFHGPGSLTDLDFSWTGTNSFTYDGTADIAFMEFDAAGKLTDFMFGTDCDSGGCYALGVSDWYIRIDTMKEWTPVSVVGLIVHGTYGVYRGPGEISPVAAVPEPTTMLLLGLGLVGLAGLRKKL